MRRFARARHAPDPDEIEMIEYPRFTLEYDLDEVR